MFCRFQYSCFALIKFLQAYIASTCKLLYLGNRIEKTGTKQICRPFINHTNEASLCIQGKDIITPLCNYPENISDSNYLNHSLLLPSPSFLLLPEELMQNSKDHRARNHPRQQYVSCHHPIGMHI